VFCWSATTSAEEEDESVNGYPLAITLVRIVSRNTIHTDEDGRTDGNSVRRVNPSKKGDVEGEGGFTSLPAKCISASSSFR
jgi:predicted acyltransferase (DUF342 family)